MIQWRGDMNHENVINSRGKKPTMIIIINMAYTPRI